MDQNQRAREIAFRQNRLRTVMTAQGFINPNTGLVMDANETAFLERELRYLETTALQRQYPALKHRTLFPRTTPPRGAATVSYRMTEQVRRAIVVAAGKATDIPRADVFSTEWPTPMRPVASAFYFDVMELENAAFSGYQIDRERGAASRDSVEQQINDIAFYGDAPNGLPGAANNPNVPVVAAVAFGGQTVWNNSGTIKGAEGIYNDIVSLFTQILTATNGLGVANKVVLPTALMNILRVKPWSISGGSDKTILQVMQANFPGVTFEDTFNLDAGNPLAVTANVDNRIMAYQDDVSVIDELIASDFETMEPDRAGMGWETIGFGICGGVRIRKPKFVAYLDGAAA